MANSLMSCTGQLLNRMIRAVGEVGEQAIVQVGTCQRAVSEALLVSGEPVSVSSRTNSERETSGG